MSETTFQQLEDKTFFVLIGTEESPLYRKRSNWAIPYRNNSHLATFADGGLILKPGYNAGVAVAPEAKVMRVSFRG